MSSRPRRAFLLRAEDATVSSDFINLYWDNLAHQNLHSGLDLQLLGMQNAKERDIDDWTKLLKDADPRFKLEAVNMPPNSLLAMIVVAWEADEMHEAVPGLPHQNASEAATPTFLHTNGQPQANKIAPLNNDATGPSLTQHLGNGNTSVTAESIEEGKNVSELQVEGPEHGERSAGDIATTKVKGQGLIALEINGHMAG